MAKIKVTLPGLEIPVNGKQVSFVAPCDCSVADGIQIDGVDYDIVDSIGNPVSFGRGVWCEGALLSVILDVTNHKAYLQNQNSYTKAETLIPATARLFGLEANAVPNDVFDFLGKYSQHWWSVRHGQAKTGYEETRKAIADDITIYNKAFSGSTAARSIYYSKEISIDQTNGTVALVNPVEIVLASGFKQADAVEVATLLTGLAPVYLTNVSENESGIYYIPEGATHGTTLQDCTLAYGRTSSDNTFYLKDASTAPIASVVTSVLYNVPAGGVTYEYSSDRNAYPDNGAVGNETYQYLGIPFDKTTTALRVENVTYTGAGVYGKSNYNSLTFSFRPLLVIVLAAISSKGVITNKLDGMADAAVPFLATTEFAEDCGFGGGSGRLSADGKTFEWYSDGSAAQLNTEGTTYHVMAIGLG